MADRDQGKTGVIAGTARWGVGLAAAFLLTGAAPSEGAEEPMRMLLAASAQTVPRGSFCYDPFVKRPRPTLGEVLAVPLGALDGGENRIVGGCVRGRCTVRITHQGQEEDVFSYEFRFRAVRGRLVPASLQCMWTP